MEGLTPAPMTPGTDESPRRTASVLFATIGVLVVLVAVLVVALVVVTGRSGDDDAQRGPNDDTSSEPDVATAPTSDPVTSETPVATESAPTPGPAAVLALAEAQDATRKFMLAINTYGPDDLDEAGRLRGYEAAVAEMLTPAFRREFRSAADLAADSVAQAGLERTADVYGSGVASLTDDFASVLITGAITQSYPGADGPGRTEFEPQLFRYLVSLDRGSGQWLIADFAAVDDDFAGTGMPEADDQIATSARQAQARAESAASAVLSYDYRRLDEDYADAVAYMTPTYEQAYSENFNRVVRKNAAATKTTVQVLLRESGVATIGEDRVEVLLFVDRPTRNASGDKLSRDHATFTMALVDGEWYVEDIQTTQP